MKRFKRTGLTGLLMLILVAAAGPTSASAKGVFTAATYPVKIESNTLKMLLEVRNSKGAECKIPAFKLSLAASNSTLMPASANGTCDTWAGTVPLEMNGCQFIFHPGTKLENGKFKGEWDLGPENCGPIKIEINYCKNTIDAATWGGPADYSVEGGKIVISPGAVRFPFTYEGVGCGGKGSQNGEALLWDWTLTGADIGGGYQEMGLLENKLSLGGVGPKFEAAGYPSSFSGSSGGSTFGLTASNLKLECAKTTVGGVIAEATTQLSLEPQYGECTATVGEKTPASALVAMNGCHYGLSVNAGSSYAGKLGVGCEGASPIEVKIYPKNEYKAVICTYKFAAQAGQEGVELSNLSDGVNAKANVTGLTYERTGILCGGKLSASNGGITYSTVLAP